MVRSRNRKSLDSTFWENFIPKNRVPFSNEMDSAPRPDGLIHFSSWSARRLGLLLVVFDLESSSFAFSSRLASTTLRRAFLTMEAELMRRVLIIYTGGTIGMKPTPDGLRPMPQYLGNQLSKMPQFHDPGQPLHTTPMSRLGRRISYTIHEWDTLLDSSNSTSPTILERCLNFS
jgi:hypothetical protein